MLVIFLCGGQEDMILFVQWYYFSLGFPGGSMVESTCSAGDLGLIPGSQRFPKEGNGNLYSGDLV